MAIRRKTIAFFVSLAFLLVVPLAVSTPAAAANVDIVLFGSTAGGWGATNTSETSPGPELAVHVGDNVTMILNATDTRNHNWYIDYNNNSAVNAGEPSSPTFTNSELRWNFTVSNRTGTFRYRSHFGPDTAMWGNITIANVTAGGVIPGVDNSVLIVLGVVVVVIAVLAVVTLLWRRPKGPETPPPPPS